jgi:predicted nucleotidyltransferase component of viral defense system
MLNYNTVTPLLRSILETLMQAAVFDQFRLVGGTALSLYQGHRMSVDIDLFTATDYGTVDFEAIDAYLRQTYLYVDTNDFDEIGFGKSYYIGNSEQECIKLDLFYTDAFIEDVIVTDNIRMATVEEIIAMKLDIISRAGRKKDFWDIHELKDSYSITEMLDLHEKRYPYNHNRALLITNFTNFSEADDDFEPDCLRGKHWELIKLDLIEFINTPLE